MTKISTDIQKGLEDILIDEDYSQFNCAPSGAAQPVGCLQETDAVEALKNKPTIDAAGDQQVDDIYKNYNDLYLPANKPSAQTVLDYKKQILTQAIKASGLEPQETTSVSASSEVAPAQGARAQGVKAQAREVAAVSLAKDFFEYVNNAMSEGSLTEVSDAQLMEYWEKFAQDNSDNESLKDTQKTVFNALGILTTGRKAAYSGMALATLVLATEIILSFQDNMPSDSTMLMSLFMPFGFDLASLNRDLEGPINLNIMLSGLLGQIFINPVGENLVDSIQDDKARLLVKDTLALSLLVGMIPTMQVKADALTFPWGARYQSSFRDMVQALVDQLYVNPDLGIRPWQQAYTPEVGSGSKLDLLSFALRGAMAIQFVADANISAKQHVKGSLDQFVIGSPETAAGLDDSFQVTSFVVATNHSAKGMASSINDALALTDLIIQTAEDVGQLQKWDSNQTSKMAPAAAFGITMLAVALPITASLANNPAKVDGLESVDDYRNKWSLETTNKTIQAVGTKASLEVGGGFLLGGLQAMSAAYSHNQQETVQAFMQVNRLFGRNTFAAMTGANAYSDVNSVYQGSGSGNINDYQFGSITNMMNSLGLTDLPLPLYAGLAAGSTAGLSDNPASPEYWPAYLGFGLNMFKLVEAYQLRSQIIESSGKVSAISEGANQAVSLEWANLAIYSVSTVVSYAITQKTGRTYDLKLSTEGNRYKVESQIAATGTGLSANFTVGASTEKGGSVAERINQNTALMVRAEQRVAELQDILSETSPEDENVAFLNEELYGAQKAFLQAQMQQVVLNAEALNQEVGYLNAALASGVIPYQADIMIWGVQRETAQKYLEENPQATADQLAAVLDQVANLDRNALSARYRDLTGRDVRLSGMNDIVRQYRDHLENQQQQLVGLSTAIEESGILMS